MKVKTNENLATGGSYDDITGAEGISYWSWV